MLDVAIVGGGLCGLALAHSLQARGSDWRLFEARSRLGGRVLTAKDAGGTPVDLGATWYWPGTQPAITRLVADLGLNGFEQLDDGRVLHLSDPNRVPQTVALTAQLQPAADATVPATPGAVHGGARRVEGGMAAVIDALARPLPAARLRLGQRLLALVDHGDFVELQFSDGSTPMSVQARRVVLALPPRVAEAALRFTPGLTPELSASLRGTPTWMATAAKAGFTYRRAFWREAGHSGNAWVSHAQAMLAEVFDASPPTGAAALAGFAALDAAQRNSFSRGRDLLLASQLEQLFGIEASDPALLQASFWQDWASEPETCSPLDLAEEGLNVDGHPPYGDALQAAAHWQGRLFFGGSETARQGGGYLEGALGAAGRLRQQLLAGSAARLRPRAAANDAPAGQAQIDAFAAWVQKERGQALAHYREHVHQALSRQDEAQLTQRAVLAALEALHATALARIEALPPGGAAEALLRPFDGLADELLAEVLIYNKTSCALSNFPLEHAPGGAYVRSMRTALLSAGEAFASALRERVHARSGLAV